MSQETRMNLKAKDYTILKNSKKIKDCWLSPPNLDHVNLSFILGKPGKNKGNSRQIQVSIFAKFWLDP